MVASLEIDDREGPLGKANPERSTSTDGLQLGRAPDEPDLLSPPTSPSPDPSRAVHKIVMRQGDGPVVPLHSTCLVRHAGRILSTGDIFVDDSQAAPDGGGELTHIVAGRDAVRNNLGLYQVVGTMRKGEICHAWVDSSMGYGREGNFSFPSVPPGSDLSYAIELVDFEPPPSERDVQDGFMTYEERLEAAKRRRVLGNEAFAKGTPEETEAALAAYKSSLAFLDDDFMMQLYEFHFDKAMEEKTSAMLNMAACYLRLGRPREAADAATAVLAHDGKNVKALYRRGTSRRMLGQTKGALDDLERARELADAGGGSDAGINREITLVKAELRKEDRAQGALYKNIMAKMMASERTVGGSDRSATDRGRAEDRNGQDVAGRGRRDVETPPNASDGRNRRLPRGRSDRHAAGFLSLLFAFVLRLWDTLCRVFRGSDRR